MHTFHLDMPNVSVLYKHTMSTCSCDGCMGTAALQLQKTIIYYPHYVSNSLNRAAMSIVCHDWQSFLLTSIMGKDLSMEVDCPKSINELPLTNSKEDELQSMGQWCISRFVARAHS